MQAMLSFHQTTDVVLAGQEQKIRSMMQALGLDIII